MEMMEKVERLREKANVSYEEAKDALEQANGDLLDAIVLLERQGKVKGPAQSTFSTDYEEQTEFVKVRDKVEEQENSAPSFGRTFGRLFRGFIGFIKNTTFIVTKGEDVLFTMPTICFALLLFFFWDSGRYSLPSWSLPCSSGSGTYLREKKRRRRPIRS